MTRLLFITERFPPDIGGVASSAGRITAALCQLGISVDVLAWSRYLQSGEVLAPDPDRLTDKTPQVHRVGLYRHWDMTMPHTLNLLDWLHQAHPYDATWGHYVFPAGFLATWFSQLKGLPSLVSARGNDIDRTLFPPGDFARLQWTLERANLIAAVSQDIAGKIQLLSQRNDIALLKNAVDDRLFSPVTDRQSRHTLRSSLGIREDEAVLGFSGELREKKGQQFLLNALTTVRSQRPACLLIIGEVRPSEQAILQTYASQYPEDAQRIITIGHLSPAAVAQHLQLCDVYLQPSLWEGMPNALLEAMACGCGCIASDAGGTPEVIEHGTNGFLISRSQLHRLGEAVLEYLSLDAAARHQIAKAARDRIQIHHSLTQEKENLQLILARLIPSSS